MGTYYVRDRHNDTLVDIEVSQKDGIVLDVSSDVDLRMYTQILLTEPWGNLTDQIRYIEQMCGWSEFRGYWWESFVMPKGKDFVPTADDMDQMIRLLVAELADLTPSRGFCIVTD